MNQEQTELTTEAPKKSKWVVPIAILLAGLILLGISLYSSNDEQTKKEIIENDIVVQQCEDANNDAVCDEPLVIVDENALLAESGGDIIATVE